MGKVWRIAPWFESNFRKWPHGTFDKIQITFHSLLSILDLWNIFHTVRQCDMHTLLILTHSNNEWHCISHCHMEEILPKCSICIAFIFPSIQQVNLISEIKQSRTHRSNTETSSLSDRGLRTKTSNQKPHPNKTPHFFHSIVLEDDTNKNNYFETSLVLLVFSKTLWNLLQEPLQSIYFFFSRQNINNSCSYSATSCIQEVDRTIVSSIAYWTNICLQFYWPLDIWEHNIWHFELTKAYSSAN